MAEMVKHDANFGYYARWNDQAKAWNDASLMLGAHKKSAIVSDIIVDTYDEVHSLPDPVVDVNKTFTLTKGYIVKDEESYGLLPESYRSVYGEWGTPGLEESLPWLAVEFNATPAKDLVIRVKGPNKFNKKISYPDVDKEVSLLTLNAEELGTDIVEGVWKVLVNDDSKELVMKAEPVESESADPKVEE